MADTNAVVIAPQSEVYRGIQIHFYYNDGTYRFTDRSGREHTGDLEYCRAAIDLMHLVLEMVRLDKCKP